LENDILTVLGQIGTVGTAIGTIALVFIFWKTIQQFEETVKVSKIQSQYRFRPWVGPSGKIEFIAKNDGKDQFCITVKNYGEIPSTSVVAKYLMKTELPKREMLSSSETTSFNLGPLLPNMEKRYWFFVESDLIQKAKGDLNVFTLIYFQYEHHDGKSGYGLISKFDGTSNSFSHVDMWID
jgi:hypothetical protein